MGSFVVPGVMTAVGGVADADFVCRGADFAVRARYRAGWRCLSAGQWFWLGRSVAMVSASASGPGGLVEWSVVDGLPEMDLPRFRSAACGVPGVEADEVVPDECDGHEHGCRDKSGLSEEAAVDAQPLIAVGADEPFDEGPAVERQGPARRLSRVVLPVAFELAVVDCDGLAASAGLAGGAGRGGEGVRHPHGRRGVGAADLEGVAVDGWAAEALGAPLRVELGVWDEPVRLAGVERFSTPRLLGDCHAQHGRLKTPMGFGQRARLEASEVMGVSGGPERTTIRETRYETRCHW